MSIQHLCYELDPWLLPPVVWGGGALQRRFGKDAPPDVKLGEAWEISCIPGRESRIRGLDATLRQVFEQAPGWLLGPGCSAATQFPLLVKLLSTADRLSVQVHPDDGQARALESPSATGKHEAWVVLDAAPGAKLYAGLRPGASTADLFAAATRGDHAAVEALLLSHEPERGDTFEIPPGLVHAPAAGLVLYEIQQPSDLTYRIYDWGRVGLDGRPRPLHVEKARAIIRPTQVATRIPLASVVPAAPGIRRLISTPLFELDWWDVDARRTVPVRDLLLITCVGGSGALMAAGEPAITLRPGRSCVVARGAAMIELDGQGLELLVARPSRGTAPGS